MIEPMEQNHQRLDANGNQVPAPELMTVDQVAGRLNVHPNTVRRWAQQGLLNPYRIGPRGDRRFRPDDVERFLRINPSRVFA